MTPQHPGVKIENYVKAHGVNLSKLALELGLSRRVLQYVFTGDRRVTPLIAAKLESALGFRAESLLADQAEFDLWQARLALQEYRDQHPGESKQMSFAMAG
jgi:addiction module HigA family antidote